MFSDCYSSFSIYCALYCRSSIVNPLVAAGLIPVELSDILVTPPNDAAVIKKWTKGITGARYLTSDDYEKMLDEAERKKKEIEKQKQRKKEEREQKRREKEEQESEMLGGKAKERVN